MVYACAYAALRAPGFLLRGMYWRKSPYALLTRCVFLWNLFVACVSAYAGSFLKGKWCKGRRSCGWSGSTRRASGTTATKSGEFASTLFAKRLGLCRKFFCRGCTNKSGKYWGHLKLPTTKCTPKDRSSSQGSQDEIHKPCFLLKIGSPILPKHPATWHEVGHPSGQDMAENSLIWAICLLTGSSGSYAFLLPNKLPNILYTNSIMLNYCIPTSLTHPLTQHNFSMMWEVVRVARIISSH